MSADFKGKVALVTGAGNGIGRAAALAFARNGAQVVVADHSVQAGSETAALIQAEGKEALFVQADVSQGRDVEHLLSETVRVYGRLDFAHNNAGIEGEKARVADADEQGWSRVIQVNLIGTWLCMKYEIPPMLRQGRGSIVNTASAAAQVGLKKFSAYAASKHGILGLTKTAALEYVKFGLRINAVCPGLIDTEMTERALVGGESLGQGGGFGQFLKRTYAGVGRKVLGNRLPSGRLGSAEEVAQAVIWLCSDAASYVNGHALAVDGGFLAK